MCEYILTLCMAFAFLGFTDVTSAYANRYNANCEPQHQHRCGDSTDEHLGRGAEIDGVEPLEQFADKEDGGDGGGESGGGDFGGENDRAAASTAAE